MKCTHLPHKEAKQNALVSLQEQGFIKEKGGRVISPDLIEIFNTYHASELGMANRAYNLSLPALYEVKTTTVNDEYKSKFAKKVTTRIEPIDSAFKQIDDARKKLGIYDEQLSFGEYKRRQKLQNENLAQEQALADTGVYEYQGEIYPSKEDMEAAKNRDQSQFFMPTQNTNPTTYGSVISFKKNVLAKVQKRLDDINSQRKTIKSAELKKQALELENMITKLTSQIKGLETDPDILEKTMSVFNEDIELIQKLIADPRLENLDLADYYLSYFDTITDYSSDNKNNTLVDVSDYDKIDTDVINVLNKLSAETKRLRTKINTAKSEYLLEVIDQTPNLKAMFGNSSLEEIRDILNEFEGDIGRLSSVFLSADLNFAGQKELLGQLIVDILKEAKYKNKAVSNSYIQSIENVEADAKKALSLLGKGITYFSSLPFIGKFFSDVDYDIFWQKTSRGNKTGRIIGKYSHSWYRTLSSFVRANNSAISGAIEEGDNVKLNQALVNKYTWLNQHTDFIDLTRLPEIINNPIFSQYSSYFNPAQADAYKQQLIATIGEYEYKRLVVQQTMLVEDFTQKITNELQTIMTANGLVGPNASPANLPMNIIDHYNIFTKRHSPFEFIISHNAGQQGRVDYTVNQTGNQYQSYLNYNTYIPKKQVEKYDAVTGRTFTENSDFYDADFAQIESNPALLKFWETVSPALEWMNSKLSDANTKLNHNSLLALEKSFVNDILLNKNVGIAKKAMYMLRQTATTFKNLTSVKNTNLSADQTDNISKGIIKTLEEPVNRNMKAISMKLSSILGTTVTAKTEIDLITAPLKVQKVFEEVTGMSISEIVQEHGTSVSVGTLREYVTNQVIQEQTFNLPMMLKAYLDATSTYAAQKESFPKINILKGIYDSKSKYESSQQERTLIDQSIRDNKNQKGIENKRINSQTRMNYWINKSVKGVEDKKYWIKLGKNYTADEKKFKQEAEAYIASLNERINQSSDPDEISALEGELADAQNIIDNLGQYYAAAAIYDAVMNRWVIFKGLAFGVKAQVMNRLQGLWSALVHDTGRYWSPGNIYAANAFVNRKGLRYIPGMTTYKNEVRKVKLLVQKLGVLQDATNELDRAKGESGLRGMTKKLDPFYLVEYVEWHNQVPQILAMLMDQYIPHPTLKGQDGEPIKIPVFNGNTTTIKLEDGSDYVLDYGFPAYNIEKGQLVLKPELQDDTNKETWQDFTSQEFSTITKKIDTTLAILNGDYRSDSNTFIKSGPVGRTIMGFKSWVAANVWSRFASDQTNINLGLKNFDGAYTGALKSGKTNAAGTLLMSGAIGVGVLATGGTLGLVGGGLSFVGMAGYAARQRYLRRKAMQEEAKVLLQMTAAIQGILKKSVGLPINLISGKQIIKAHSFDELNISETEKQNLRFLVNEVTLLLTSFLTTIMVKSMFGGDDEAEEPKTIDGIHPNPYYYSKEESDDDRAAANILENTLTELIKAGTLFYNVGEMYNTAFRAAGIEGWTNSAGKIGEQVIKIVFKGDDDIIDKGIHKGHSKLGLLASQATMPGIVTNTYFNNEEEEKETTLTKKALEMAGYGTYMEKDIVNNQVIDYWYDSDYKKDKRDITKERKKYRTERTQYWEKEFNIDTMPDNIKKIMQDRIKSIVDQEVEIQKPTPNRGLYDEHQRKIQTNGQ